MRSGSIGCRVLELAGPGRVGRVAAVFERAAHLETGGEVITLGSCAISRHPYTITLERPLPPLRLGEGFRLKGTGLMLESCGEITLVGLTPFAPLRQVPHPATSDRQRVCLVSSRRSLSRCYRQGGLGGLLFGDNERSPVLALARPLVELLRGELEQEEWGRVAEPVRGLAGVGPGLTPSGDDFLCGFLAAYSFRTRSGGSGPPLGCLKEWAEIAAARTSSFSGQMLRCAALGLVSEEAASWLAAVHLGEAVAAAAAAVKLADYGHTSGIDLLCGLITALESIGTYNRAGISDG